MRVPPTGLISQYGRIGAGQAELPGSPDWPHNDNFVIREAKCCLAACVTGVSTP